MKRYLVSLGLAVALWGASTAQAQISDFENAFAPRGAEARLTVTVPFGGDKKNVKSKPQLALVGRQYQSNEHSIDWAMKTPKGRENYTESRLAITLSSQPNLLLNNQVVIQNIGTQSELSDGVKTAGKVALGAGLITLAVVVVAFGTYIIAIATHDGPLDGE